MCDAKRSTRRYGNIGEWTSPSRKYVKDIIHFCAAGDVVSGFKTSTARRERRGEEKAWAYCSSKTRLI